MPKDKAVRYVGSIPAGSTSIRIMKDNVKRRKALYFYLLSVVLDFRLVALMLFDCPPIRTKFAATSYNAQPIPVGRVVGCCVALLSIRIAC